MDTVLAPRPAISAPRAGGLPRVAAVVIALCGAFLAGSLTSFGQAGPSFVSTMSNAPGPWFLVTVALLLLVRPRLGWALPLGVVLLELMHVGYWATSNLRGFPDFLAVTNPWVLLAIPAGLLAAIVATCVRGHGAVWRSVAIGLTAAVLAGEGIRSLLRVADSTSVAFWITDIAAGAALVVVGLVVARTLVGRTVALGTAVVGTALVLVAFQLIGG